jgi:hypothetical protein
MPFDGDEKVSEAGGSPRQVKDDAMCCKLRALVVIAFAR